MHHTLLYMDIGHQHQSYVNYYYHLQVEAKGCILVIDAVKECPCLFHVILR